MNHLASDAPASASPPGPARMSRWQKFRMIVKVVELRLRFVVLMAATALVFAYWDTIWNYYEKWTRPAEVRQAVRSDIEFYCPMHPTVVQGEPGSCPICGMPLSERKKGEPARLPEGVLARVELSPVRVAQAGVRTVEVEYTPLNETVTTVGSVELDERLVKRISSRLKGMSRVEKLFVNFNGTTVKQGEPLAVLYSGELYQAVQELLVAHRSAQSSTPRAAASSLARSVMGDAGELVRSSIEKLKLWGLTQEQIDTFLREGKADFRLTILAPIGGVVLKKEVVEGQYVAEGDPMFEVADLSRIWVKAQIYEDQVGAVSVGQEVDARVEAFPGEIFRGTVAFIDPVLNPATRTVSVRYDMQNPGGRLRPGMFATVTLKTPIADTAAFRDLAATQPGGKSAGGVAATEVCLVTGLKLGSMGDPVEIEVEGKKVRMCCEACEVKLKKKPAMYLARLRSAPEDSVLTIPDSAVIDTGLRTLVYVQAEPGIFEARQVVLGPRSGGFFPVLDGLLPGEFVATAGAFLIDAENRLTSSTGMPYGTPGGRQSETNAPAPDSQPAAAATSDSRHLH
jgi:Cu(I)/Ag(I) efflux system membrane fusion protein